ncbi:MAG: PCRF domain-containing protein, partial [Firmicutes bacterium]|nr:PCRF domain-containing protein [Candidatus Caballimonas caccae]
MRQGTLFDIDKLREEYKEKVAISEKPEVYNDLEKSQKISKEIVSLENKVSAFDKAEKTINDTAEIIDMISEDDEALFSEIDEELKAVYTTVEDMRLKALLRGKYDKLNAILTLHAGAGGTEACDWTEMLYRMYMYYAEKSGYT